MTQPTLVAVYGSLRKAHGNNSLLRRYNAAHVATTKTKNMHAMYSLGGFPFVCLSRPVSQVTVEVYEVNEDCLMALDRLEGYRGGDGDFYSRSLVELEDGNSALIYHIEDRPASDNTLVTHGDWTKYCAERTRRYE